MPSQVDNYSILERVQEVAGAQYLRAHDAQRSRDLLLIVLNARRSASRTAQIQFTYTRAKELMPRLQVLTAHKNIAPFQASLRSELGVAYDDRKGVPLTQWRARYGHATQHDAISLSLELLDALAFVHDHNLLHRALSPAMIWVHDAPTLRLSTVYGVGFAELLQIERTWAQTATVQTDVRWMAPEQFTGETLGRGTDIYAVGLLLHFLLSDVPAIAGTSIFERVQHHCEGQHQPVSPQDRASPRLHAIIERALRRIPAERYAEAREMAHALREELPKATRALPQINATRPQFLGESTAQPATPPPSKAEALQPAPVPNQQNPKTGSTRQDDPTPQDDPTQQNLRAENATPRHHARLVDLSTINEEQSADKKGADNANTTKKQGFPWRVLLIAWGLAMCIGGGALWMLRSAQDHDDDPSAEIAEGQTEPTPDCRWDNVARSLAVGDTAMPMSKDSSALFSYDRMTIRVYLSSTKHPVEHPIEQLAEPPAEDSSEQVADHPTERSRPLRFIRAFGGAQIWHRRTPEAQRDWFFILPRVRNAQRPSLWVLQWNNNEIVSTQRVPLSTDTIEHARVDLRIHEGRCLLWVRTEGDTGPGPKDKEAWLRLTDPGIVMEQGALGDLWTPALEDSPF